MSPKNVNKNVSSLDCVVIGDVVWDIIIDNCSIDAIPEGGVVYTKEATITPGGSGNVACGLAFLGGKAVFIGKSGEDILGELYEKNLEEHGVKCKIFRDKTTKTGFAIVFLGKNQQRTFIVYRGANNHLSCDEIKKLDSVIEKAKYFYFSGFSLANDPQKSAILEAVNMAKKTELKIVFDPGAYNLVRNNRKFFLKILEKCDVLSLNTKEAEALTNKKGLNNIIGVLREFVPLVALKRGAKGAVIITPNIVFKVSAYHVESLDTTGAGDAFVAALIYGLIQEFPLKKTGIFANWFSSELIRNFGPRSFPSKSRVNSFLSQLIGNSSFPK